LQGAAQVAAALQFPEAATVHAAAHTLPPHAHNTTSDVINVVFLNRLFIACCFGQISPAIATRILNMMPVDCAVDLPIFL
jgi:hypothetical protein